MLARENSQNTHGQSLGHVRPLSKTTTELSIQAKERVRVFQLFDFPSPGSCKKEKIVGNLKDNQRFHYLRRTFDEIGATSRCLARD